MDKEKRHHCVSMRMNKSELKELDRRRDRMQRGAYVRQALLGKTPAIIPEINRQAYSELARSASNLNQIARHLNSGGQADVHEIVMALIEFRSKLIGADHEGHE